MANNSNPEYKNNIFHERRNYTEFDIPVSVTKFTNLNYFVHWHRDIEFTYVAKGSLLVGSNRESYVLNKGDLAVFGSEDIHYYEETGKDSIVYIIVFHPSFLNITKWPQDFILKSNIIRFQDIENEVSKNKIYRNNIDECFEKAYFTIKKKNNGYEYALTAIIYEIFSVARYLLSSNINYLQKNDKNYEITRSMQAAIQYINENYMNDLCIEDVASKVGLSSSYFSRLFKETTGKHFKNYLNSVRISVSEKLINEGQLPIIDIALESGFNSLRTFNRVFKELRGCSPSEMKKSKTNS